MPKQSSIEWLIECLNIHLTEEQKTQFEGLFQQSKQMHKEEIIDAAERWKGTKFAEQYYQETFGGNKHVLGDSCNFYEQDNTTAMNCKHCGKGKWIHGGLNNLKNNFYRAD